VESPSSAHFLAVVCRSPALVGFAPLSNGQTSLSSHSIGPGRILSRPPFLRFVRGVAPLIPFHRLHPRRPPSHGVATISDSSSKLESRSDPVVSHDFVGFLRRLLGFSPGYSSLFIVTKDLRICCAPLPIVGFDAFRSPHPVEPAPKALSLLTPSLAGHSDSRFPASSFVPPGGFPPPAARCVATPLDARRRAPCPLGLCVSLDLDRPDEAVSNFTVVAVSRGRGPSRRCSASRSVPADVL